ncbi:MAG: hypothetical protein AAF098_12675 [Pseudomonadota bacterium]
MISLPANVTFEGVAGQLPERVLQLFAAALHSRVWPDGSQLTEAQRDVCAEVLQLRWKVSIDDANLDSFFGSRSQPGAYARRYPQGSRSDGVSIH